MKKFRGFTLVEMVITVAVLGILIGFGVAKYKNHLQKAENLSIVEAGRVIASEVNNIFLSGKYKKSDLYKLNDPDDNFGKTILKEAIDNININPEIAKQFYTVILVDDKYKVRMTSTELKDLDLSKIKIVIQWEERKSKVSNPQYIFTDGECENLYRFQFNKIVKLKNPILAKGQGTYYFVY